MSTKTQQRINGALIFRIALFLAAASLAAYIPFKYATSLHAISGLYAFMFPLSGILAIAGMAFAIKPTMACDCGGGLDSSVAGVSVLWGVTGMACTGSLFSMVMATPTAGLFATFHMLAQHIFLPASLLAFIFARSWMLNKLGFEWTATKPAKTPVNASPVKA